MKKALILIWGYCFLNGFLARSQESSYIQYHRGFSQVEALIVNEQFKEAELEKGNLHPRAFATIYNFEQSKVSVLYAKSTKKYNKLPEYQFNFPFGAKSTDLEAVNADRLKFGICSYEVELKMDEISRKYGMKLKFGY